MKRRDFLSIGAAGVAAAWLPQGALAQKLLEHLI